MRKTLLLVLWVGVAASTKAQVPVTPEQTDEINRALDHEPAGERLKCEVQRAGPSLDFEFRFTAGYTIKCPLKEFEGKKSWLNSFVRVTPEGGTPLVLGETAKLPAVPPEMEATTNPGKLNNDVEISGAFSVGEGQYQVAILVVDDRRRSCRKQWKINVAAPHPARASAMVMKANTAAPTEFVPWNGKLQTQGDSVRLTVLLDVAPINPRVPTLRAWDRFILLDSLSSLLRQMPCKSVRLVAFNLAQQREIYRAERFSGGDQFDGLQKAMRDLELGTVSYHVLERPQGWVSLLSGLIAQELRAEDPSDAVVILGPDTHTQIKIEKRRLIARETRNPRFFYFEYSPNWFGGSFPDSMGTVTKALDGTSFIFHSPEELAQDIQKMLKQLRPSVPPAATAGQWPPRPGPKP